MPGKVPNSFWINIANPVLGTRTKTPCNSIFTRRFYLYPDVEYRITFSYVEIRIHSKAQIVTTILPSPTCSNTLQTAVYVYKSFNFFLTYCF